MFITFVPELSISTLVEVTLNRRPRDPPSWNRIHMKELWERVIPICDCFILIWWKGLILQVVNSKRFKQQVEKTSPKNLNLFEFVGLVTETKF